jgi:hypothetical protein
VAVGGQPVAQLLGVGAGEGGAPGARRRRRIGAQLRLGGVLPRLPLLLLLLLLLLVLLQLLPKERRSRRGGGGGSRLLLLLLLLVLVLLLHGGSLGGGRLQTRVDGKISAAVSHASTGRIQVEKC